VTSLAFSEEGKATFGTNGQVVDVMSMVELVEKDLSLDGSEPVFGSADATVQLVEFADFECPHCAMTAPKIKKLVQDNSNVNLRFKQYPLSSNCNPNVQALAHENACAAAAATECAHLQGKFWEMNKIIFKNQNYLSPTDIDFLAEQVGLDLSKFKTCMSDESIAKGISADIEAAELVGVTGTPSIFIKGIGEMSRWYKLDSNHTVEDLGIALKAMSEKK
jgi:protein-disulfide isomerase